MAGNGDGFINGAALKAAMPLIDEVLRSHAALVVGPPDCGKTTFALEVLLAEMDRASGSAELAGSADSTGGVQNSDETAQPAVMTVSNRKIADALSDEVIRRRGATSTARPVTTLSAVAFRLLSAVRASERKPLPKLLNGAEQEALLREAVMAHVAHARAGELCDTCRLLRQYFAAEDWAGRVYDDQADASASASRTTSEGAGISEDLFARGVNDAFVMQLRDMLARMDELGVGRNNENEVLAALGEAQSHSARTERLGVQWRLAFALREEYASLVGREYPDQFRLDSSRLLVEGAKATEHASEGMLPRLVVVDDFQDLTLAGMTFLEKLSGRGAGLVLVGDPDEAVQTFRGSYPEYLFARAKDGVLKAHPFVIDAAVGAQAALSERIRSSDTSEPVGADADYADGRVTYRDLLASRVSLSIASGENDPTPLPDRPGKLPRIAGSLPIAPLDDNDKLPGDGSVSTALYRSSAEELDDVVWHIKRAHLVSGARPWNAMAVIAHDNATVRAFGERLRRDGVPVRYSAVTKPLKDDSSVQGLFALLELAELRRRGEQVLGQVQGDLTGLARFVRSRCTALLESPLLETVTSSGAVASAVRMAPVESAMRAVEALARVVGADVGGGNDGTVDTGDDELSDAREVVDRTALLPRLLKDWNALERRNGEVLASRSVEVDDSVMTGSVAGSGKARDESGPAEVPSVDMPFGVNSMMVMLALGESQGADEVLELLSAVGAGNVHIAAFTRMWKLVADVAKRLDRLQENEPQYALWEAWSACHVAERWQKEALAGGAAGREANDRLDVMMRLFDYAAGSGAAQSVPDFLASVRAMRIEADSLAQVAPIDDAVTLTTPAGAAGQHWPLVWVVGVQQGVWPNLALRNTMFGGEDLADIVLHGGLSDDAEREVTGSDPQLLRVLASEQKSFLVALTRASEQVTLSAALSDDAAPSDFLYGYVPERFDRDRDADAATRQYTQLADADRYAGLDADPRGMVGAARVELARQSGADESESMRVQDAANTLALLADGDAVPAANPDEWAYVKSQVGQGRHDVSQLDKNVGTAQKELDTGERAVRLSPSQVDRIWECPVCWMLENKFAGPRPSSSATSFGTLIHAVAQQAGETGLDAPDFMAGRPLDERIDAVAERMMDMYMGLRPDISGVIDPEERYKALAKDENARQTLHHIADYFVRSNESDYAGGNARHFTVGRLDHADCELPFTAEFGLENILGTYNAIPGVDPIDRHELCALMGALVGGWPSGMSESIVIRLAGSIDRLEWRSNEDGAEPTVRVIDYKTGHAHGPKQMFNDLQLVCYQLGLAFGRVEEGARDAAAIGSEHDGRSGSADPLPDGPWHVGRAMLFDVEESAAPAANQSPESKYQPSLFVGDSLNATAFAPRDRYRKPDALLDLPVLPDVAPDGVSEHAWSQFLALRGSQAVWSLTMISRVFYAAAASRSRSLVAHPQPEHVRYCRMKGVCPACSGEVNTVYETRRA